MSRRAVLAGAAAFGLSGQAFGYYATGTVTVSWGGNYGGTAAADSFYGVTSDTTADIGWTRQAVLASIADSTYFSAQSGYLQRSYYNADFATVAQCTAGSTVLPTTATAPIRRKYGCRFTSSAGGSYFLATPVTDAAAATMGASATGSIMVTDTTLTGTLTLNSTTDEPTGATTTFSTSGVRLSNSAGNGLNGYNYRSADGSPFGNYWQGTTTAGTLTVNLTGTFTSSAWSITGGTVAFTDNGFACQQGGLGSTTDPAAGTLCTRSTVVGGQTTNGSHLSWGGDIDGAGTSTTFTELEVRSSVGGSIIETLSGVLASLSVSGGTLTTNSGEFRRALASSGSGCSTYIVYDGTRISCGTLTTGRLNITGTVNDAVIPVPATVWLMGSALGLLGWIRRKAGA